MWTRVSPTRRRPARGRRRRRVSVGWPGSRGRTGPAGDQRACSGAPPWSLAPLAGEPARRERAPGDHAHAVLLADGEHVGLDAAHEHRVGRLLGDEPLAAAPLGDPLRIDDLARRKRRRPEGADLAGVDEIGQRRERLVVIGVGIGAVDLVEVDLVRAKSAQARVAVAHDPTTRVARSLMSSPIEPCAFVASTTSSRRPLRALPTISSDSPRE